MQNMTQTIGKMALGLSSNLNYLELLKTFPPRPIANEEDFNKTQKIIDTLIDKGELTPDEQDYLSVLGSLIRDYEDINLTLPKLNPVELIQALLDDAGLQIQDLTFIFGNEITVSKILTNQQELTLSQIKKLAQFFKISPAAFLG
jgi:HTH-type transcriptional regulator / antitoxin HigA